MTALENKTVVLVTHQVEFLAQVEKILVTKLSSDYISTVLHALIMISIYKGTLCFASFNPSGYARWTSDTIRKL